MKQELLNCQVDLVDILSIYEQPEITFNDAISDLPIVKAKQFPEDYIMPYDKVPRNAFQKHMRGECISLYNHIPMQHTSKTVQNLNFS